MYTERILKQIRGSLDVILILKKQNQNIVFETLLFDYLEAADAGKIPTSHTQATSEASHC